MSECTNVCGIRSKALLELPAEDWLEVVRPSGKKLRVCLNIHGKYAMWVGDGEEELFDSLGELKKRLREFP